MTQPDLLSFALHPIEPTPRRPRVRQTSKQAVTVMRDSGLLQQRTDDITHWLSWHANATASHPTTAELAVWLSTKGHAQHGLQTALGRFLAHDLTWRKNYIARGLWEAQEAAMVEAVPNGQRKCAVNRRKAETWRLRQV